MFLRMRCYGHGVETDEGERGGILVNEGPLTSMVLRMRCYGHGVETDEGERGGVLVN